MKKLILITILAFLMSGIQAQDKAKILNNNNWRTEVGSIFTGDKYSPGTSIYSEYFKYISSRFKLAVGLGSQNFGSTHKGEFKQGDIWLNDADALMVGVSGYYDIFKTKRINLELGFGCFLKKWDVTDLTVRMIPENPNWITSSVDDASKKNISLTPSISLGSQLYISDKISVNLRGFYQQGVENNSTAVFGIAGGVILKWNNK